MSGKTLECGPAETTLTIAHEANADQDFQVTDPPLERIPPRLLFMAGFAGAGKTTFATALNQHILHWKVLDKDTLKLNRLATGEEEEEAGWNAFEDLLKMIREEAIKKGKSAIIDASNEKPFVFHDVLKVLREGEPSQMKFSLKIILCVASKPTRTQRIHKRGSVFAPYVQSLPDILDDAELPERFYHFFDEDPEALRQLQYLASRRKELECFSSFSSGKALILNTNVPLETYPEDIWDKIKAFLQEDEPLSCDVPR